MSEEPAGGTEVTSDDRLLAALAYILSPIVPIILMLMEDKKNRPFIRAHNAQALVFGILLAVLGSLGALTVVGICIFPLGFLVELFWGYKAYQGDFVNIPVITDFVKNQGWA